MTHSPTPVQRRAAATAIRRIGRLRPTARNSAFWCGRCQVGWSGAEADCWNCSLPATGGPTHPSTALTALLHAVKLRRPPNAEKPR